MSILEKEARAATAFQNGFDVSIRALVDAAEAGDEARFLTAYQAIDWSARSPAEFVYAVRLALMAGAHLAARKLAQTGSEQYPTQAELQKMARILAPPKVKCRQHAPDPGLRANRDWLRNHAGIYQGQWVALRNGHLLSLAATHDALIQQIGSLPNTNILVTKVY